MYLPGAQICAALSIQLKRERLIGRLPASMPGAAEKIWFKETRT